ncbi:MAG: FtsX-like permease family protein, partial [Actinomycetota bacterium]|nr:FtsX-like permease family protein [Actinomycetota bacterium]
VPAWRSARSAGTPAGGQGVERTSRVASALANVGASPATVSGVRMALEAGRGHTAVPVRSTIMGTALGVATIAGILSFTGSIGHLFDRPPLYGWNWDVQVGSAFSPDLAAVGERLASDPSVAEVAVAAQARFQINGQPVDTLGIEPVRGAIEPTVVEGRAPRAPGDILLGTRTLRDLDLAVGDTVPVTFANRTLHLHVVGRGVMSEFAGAARLGEGASVTLAGLRQLVPDAVRNLVLVRAYAGSDTPALVDELQVMYGAEGVYLPTKPSDLADLERIGGLPFAVAGLMAVMAMTTVAHMLATLVRRRRRDLAVLKVLGFTRSQVVTTVAWQSSTLALVAGVLGLPLGIAAGRTAWEVFADRLGVPPRPVTPLVAVALFVPALLVLANLIAVLPGLLAARARPGPALREE